MDNENELEDSQNLEELATPENLELSQAEALEQLREKNKQLFERAKKAEEKLKETRQEKPEVKPVTSVTSAPVDLEKINLRLDGYSEDEVEYLMKVGGSSMKNDEFVKAGIESIRAKKKSEEASISSSSKSPVYLKYTAEELEAMPLDEHEKILRTLKPE